jgi:hypothetical protein
MLEEDKQIQHQPILLEWKDVEYTVKVPPQNQSVTGTCEEYQLTVKKSYALVAVQKTTSAKPSYQTWQVMYYLEKHLLSLAPLVLAR